jgi:6-phosphogluconolactonase (cycloisomerase 2 family)
MSTRFAWLLGAVLVLAALGLLVACSSLYNRSSDGLMLVGSEGSALIQTFSFSLSSGSATGISNPTSDTSSQTCVLPGIPSSMVLDPAGAFAYTIITSNAVCQGTTGIMAIQVNSDGTIAKTGTLTQDPNPIALAMDSAGKFLFVTEGLGGTVSVYAIGSGGSLTNVPQTFALPHQPGFQPSNFVALALTPTVFPSVKNGTQTGACFQQSAPTSEFLYVVDEPNNAVWEFDVDMSTGALTVSPSMVPPSTPFVTDQLPAGIAVDPCNRFVYVTNSQSGKLSAYTICHTVITPQPCPVADGHLVPVPNSPFTLNGSTVSPGPVIVDPLGNNVYVVDTGASHVFSFHISPVSGGVAAGTPASVATGQRPTAIAFRSDGNWLFVSNFNSGTVSQYAVTPVSGNLSPLPDIITDNQPTGIAVK